MDSIQNNALSGTRRLHCLAVKIRLSAVGKACGFNGYRKVPLPNNQNSKRHENGTIFSQIA